MPRPKALDFKDQDAIEAEKSIRELEEEAIDNLIAESHPDTDLQLNDLPWEEQADIIAAAQQRAIDVYSAELDRVYESQKYRRMGL